VPIHSKGLNFLSPINSCIIGNNCFFLNKFSPKILIKFFSSTKGYKLVKINKHFGHFPHHFLEGFLKPEAVL